MEKSKAFQTNLCIIHMLRRRKLRRFHGRNRLRDCDVVCGEGQDGGPRSAPTSSNVEEAQQAFEDGQNAKHQRKQFATDNSHNVLHFASVLSLKRHKQSFYSIDAKIVIKCKCQWQNHENGLWWLVWPITVIVLKAYIKWIITSIVILFFRSVASLFNNVKTSLKKMFSSVASMNWIIAAMQFQKPLICLFSNHNALVPPI